MDIHTASTGTVPLALKGLAQFESSPHFSDREKLVLRLVTSLTLTPSDVPDQLFAALRVELSERELLELSAAIAWENYRARFSRTFAIEGEGFSKAEFCPLPER